MTRYFVEFSNISDTYIVHREKCITYPDCNLSQLPRMKELGDFRDDVSALASARHLYQDPSPCWCCFVKRYRKSVIASCQPSHSRLSW